MRRLWFAAHALYVFEVVQGRQEAFTVLENILLIRAPSAKLALATAKKVARREEADDPSLTVDGLPARQRFLGIRKLVACAADPLDETSADGQVRVIRSGSEASYLTYRVASKATLQALMRGREAIVTIED